MLTRKLLEAAGNAGAGALYVEDVFSTYLYDGTNTTHSIDNGIDLSGEGGLVWIKNRKTTSNHVLTDTERGAQKILYSNTTTAEVTGNFAVNAFESTGFEVTSSDTYNNAPNNYYVSWTFRKAEKFFDIVTYTGTGSTTTVSHNLGSTPGFIIVKRTDTTEDWTCYHVGVPGTANYIQLNKTDAYASNSSVFNNTAPTDSVFTVGSSGRTNASGGTYVAYLFAHDAGGFGNDGSESIIKCGSFSHTLGTSTTINLGWEPQWILYRPSNLVSNWYLFDTMRGWFVDSNGNRLYPNTTFAEGSASFYITNQGFTVSSGSDTANYIYIAIRRPMKVPTTGTSVMLPSYYNAPSLNTTSTVTTPFNVDMILCCSSNYAGANKSWIFDRMRTPSGTTSSAPLRTSSNETETTYNGLVSLGLDKNNGYTINDTNGAFNGNSATSGTKAWSIALKRAPKFFDVVCFSDDGTAEQTIYHGLGVVPEFFLIKIRNQTGSWWAIAPDYPNASGYNTTTLNGTSRFYFSGYVINRTSTTFGFTSGYSSRTRVVYMFASLAGVSKVGTYTGVSGGVNVDCGFSSGARFVLVKRIDSSGSWYVWDSARGIVAGNDIYLTLESTSAEVTGTDYIDPYSAGFTITSTAPSGLNTTGGLYLYLAIA